MKTDTHIPTHMMAPCGLTCAACYAHLRKKKPCPGCNGAESAKPGYCSRCKIKACATGRGLAYCFACPDFPCALVKQIDKRYRLKYRTSLIENGLRAQAVGVEQHLREEKQKWTCPQCGGVLNLHDRTCSECGRSLP
ncbi:MAG: DUF3795 domain-containing protein [Chloroflexi bacterium]|nr:DUF3795 domain-containing protein [Chloroflexota bacterium]